jgi:sugar lactone lactonase YvrE
MKSKMVRIQVCKPKFYYKEIDKMQVMNLIGRRPALALLLVVALSVSQIGAVTFPPVVALPNGFQPEGIAAGTGTTFFVGSIPTGAVFRGDLLTGQGSVLVPPQADRSSIGMKFDARTGLLFVAGGASGKAFIYDGNSGANVADIQLGTAPTFINDVVITRNAVYFTDSFAPVLYKLSLSDTGALPDPLTKQTIPLSGEFDFIPGTINANGIEALPNETTLIVVNFAVGALYRVDATDGSTTRLDLGSDSVPNGDGILLQGKTLYVVQNFLNQIAVVELSADFTSGEVVERITNSAFRVPTTIAAFGDALYAVNARFDTPPTPDTDYDVVRVPKK